MASTYVNDLRLNEMATGDASGTWGEVTNTNLELIAEAFSYGTEAITTNADTHTTTIADGATDPGRSLYLKYTGTLDSACTITIGPNTVSKLWFIENATSGSQNIIISQGSGANVTIPPGDVKVVYSDGAGSGAAVTDAFASLSVVDLKVQDDLTVTDDLIVNGDIDLEGNMDVNGSLETDALSLNGTTVTSTAAEINLLDGSSANTVVNSKAVIYGSSGQVAGTLSTAAQTNITSLGTLTTLTVDDITINGSTISDAGDLTLDVGGDIYLDSDNTNWRFNDGGTAILHISKPTGAVRLQSSVADADIIFGGIDGSTVIDALTLDMSDAGTAIFNHDIKLPDSGQAIFGADSDLSIYHDNSTGNIVNNTGVLNITNNDIRFKTSGAETMLRAIANGAVKLMYNNDTKLETTNGGVDISGTLTTSGLLTVNDGAIFNEGSEDKDFRVESNNNAHMLFVDGGNDHVNIGTSTDHGGVLNIETPGQGVNLVLVCTDTDANEGPILDFTRDAGNVPSDNDIMGKIRFRNDDTGLTMTNYAEITSVVADVSNGTEDGQLQLNIIDNGTLRNFAHMTGSVGTVFNEDSNDIDFRIESNDHEYKFFVDAGDNNIGIGTSSPAADVHIKQIGDIGNGNSQGLMLETGAGSQKYMLQCGRAGVSNSYFNLRDVTNTRDIFSVLDTDGKFQGHTPFEWNNAAVFNEGSQDYDFRIESNAQTHMFFVDAGKNGIGIGTSSIFDHNQSSAIDLSYDATIWAGNTYWAGGLKTGVTFYGQSSGDRYKHSSRNATQIHHNSQGGNILFNAAAGGTANAVISWQEIAEFARDEVVFNNGGVDQDFRVESNNNANMLFVDAGNDRVGIGTGITSNKLGINRTAINTNERLINLYTGTTGADNYVSIGAQYSETNALSNSEIRFGNEVASNAPSFLAFATGNTSSPTERMRITSTGNLQLALGSPLQATADGRAVNVSVNTSYVTILDFSTIGGTTAGTGFYLVTAVREGASVGTSITLQVGVSSSGLVIIYDTIQANGMVAQASNAQIQVKTTSSGAVDCHATAIPMSITGTG